MRAPPPPFPALPPLTSPTHPSTAPPLRQCRVPHWGSLESPRHPQGCVAVSTRGVSPLGPPRGGRHGWGARRVRGPRVTLCPPQVAGWQAQKKEQPMFGEEQHVRYGTPLSPLVTPHHQWDPHVTPLHPSALWCPHAPTSLLGLLSTPGLLPPGATHLCRVPWVLQAPPVPPSTPGSLCALGTAVSPLPSVPAGTPLSPAPRVPKGSSRIPAGSPGISCTPHFLCAPWVPPASLLGAWGPHMPHVHYGPPMVPGAPYPVGSPGVPAHPMSLVSPQGSPVPRVPAGCCLPAGTIGPSSAVRGR